MQHQDTSVDGGPTQSEAGISSSYQIEFAGKRITSTESSQEDGMVFNGKSDDIDEESKIHSEETIQIQSSI